MEHYYDFYPDKFEKLMDMVGSCPKENQYDAAGWMYHFIDESEVITETLKEGKVPFEEYYEFVRYNICNVDVMRNPEIKALIPMVLGQIRKTPESFEDIKDIFFNNKTFPLNEQYLNFCFNHLKDSEWKKCLEWCTNYSTY